jgi:hypothetical protein
VEIIFGFNKPFRYCPLCAYDRPLRRSSIWSAAAGALSNRASAMAVDTVLNKSDVR